MATRVACPIAMLYTILCYIGKEFEFDLVVLVKDLNLDRVIMGRDCNQSGRTRCKCALLTGSFSKQYIFSRVGGCERVFTPVRWRQVRLSCKKWRSTFFLYFFVRPSFGRQFVIRVDGCCANCVVGLAFLPSGHTTRKQRHYDAITTSCARWVG